jgi:hypothetical protein
MLEKLPSSVVLVDNDLKVIQANKSFINILDEEVKMIEDVIPGLEGADLKTLLPYNFHNLFSYVLSHDDNIVNRDVHFNDILYNVSIFTIRKNKVVGAVIRDLYVPEVRKEEVIKRVTDVIDKNLGLVQQIGFLLGEGASETEAMLNSIIESYKMPEKPRKMENNFYVEVGYQQKIMEKRESAAMYSCPAESRKRTELWQFFPTEWGTV